MNIEEKVKEILFKLCGEEITDTEVELQADLALDSMMMVALLIEIEEEFSVELDESDMNPFDLVTVKNVIDLAEKYAGGRNE